jgi:hypothetical protein
MHIYGNEIVQLQYHHNMSAFYKLCSSITINFIHHHFTQLNFLLIMSMQSNRDALIMNALVHFCNYSCNSAHLKATQKIYIP